MCIIKQNIQAKILELTKLDSKGALLVIMVIKKDSISAELLLLWKCWAVEKHPLQLLWPTLPSKL